MTSPPAPAARASIWGSEQRRPRPKMATRAPAASWPRLEFRAGVTVAPSLARPSRVIRKRVSRAGRARAWQAMAASQPASRLCCRWPANAGAARRTWAVRSRPAGEGGRTIWAWLEKRTMERKSPGAQRRQAEGECRAGRQFRRRPWIRRCRGRGCSGGEVQIRSSEAMVRVVVAQGVSLGGGSQFLRRESQVLVKVAARMTRPPRMAKGPVRSAWKNQVQMGLATGSRRRRVEDSKAGTLAYRG
jgi:hypothetical protein